MTMEELRHSFNDSRCVNGLALEILHDIQKLVINVRLIAEANFNLVKVAKGVVENWLLAVG